jgi:hypothetical protein
LLEEHSHPIKGLALLFFQEEKAYSGEKRYIEQISILLSMNPNNTFQQPLGFRSNEISPKPVINRMLHSQKQIKMNHQRIIIINKKQRVRNAME